MHSLTYNSRVAVALILVLLSALASSHYVALAPEEETTPRQLHGLAPDERFDGARTTARADGGDALGGLGVERHVVAR
jgi:hypothetical protein